MQPRLAAAAAAAVVVAFAATGCNILTPQATTIQYDASDGVSATTGTVIMHNAILIGEPDGTDLNLAVTFTNDGEPTTVAVRVGNVEEDVAVPVGVTTFGVDEQLIFAAPADLEYGQLLNVSFTADGAAPAGVSVPTITTEQVGYETLGPVAP